MCPPPSCYVSSSLPLCVLRPSMCPPSFYVSSVLLFVLFRPSMCPPPSFYVSFSVPLRVLLCPYICVLFRPSMCPSPSFYVPSSFLLRVLSVLPSVYSSTYQFHSEYDEICFTSEQERKRNERNLDSSFNAGISGQLDTKCSRPSRHHIRERKSSC